MEDMITEAVIKTNDGESPGNSTPAEQVQKTESMQDLETESTTRPDEKTDDGDKDMNEYSYLDREGFTSELYKVKLDYLPRYVGFTCLKKRLIAQKLEPKKIKLFKNRYEIYAFITFASEEEREAALTVLDGHQWKGKTLKAKKASPKADPYQMQRKRRGQEADESEPGEKKSKGADDDSTPEERLKNSVIPLWKLSYEEQLEDKSIFMKQFMMKLGWKIEKSNPDMVKWLAKQRRDFTNLGALFSCWKMLLWNAPGNETLVFGMESKRSHHSPVMEGYRNKSEFTIGTSLDGSERVVGFRFGKYRGGSCRVGEPSPCRNISPKSMEVTKAFQDFVQSNPWAPYNPETSQGHWRMVLVRTTRTGDTLATAEFHPQKMSEDELGEVKKALKNYFTEGAGKAVGMTGMFFHASTERVAGTGDKSGKQLLFGKPHIREKLLDMTFQISADAFFQVNTLGAEVLYSTINDWCHITPQSTVLDVCCGTGTIGLTMAKHVEKVIGVDICQQAIDDAKVNAELNGVKNVEYRCDKAEDAMPNIMNNLFTRDIIAIVDPPRPGLHQRVIQAIRRCSAIDRLIYVSCNPPAAMQNFEDLIRPISKKTKGVPFVPTRAVPVDLFPDTKHCELVVLFERFTNKVKSDAASFEKDSNNEHAGESEDVDLQKIKHEDSADKSANISEEQTTCSEVPVEKT